MSQGYDDERLFPCPGTPLAAAAAKIGIPSCEGQPVKRDEGLCVCCTEAEIAVKAHRRYQVRKKARAAAALEEAPK